MSKIIYNSFGLLMIGLFVSCNVTDQEKVKVEQYFKASINGESWSGEPRAGITIIQGDTLLSVYAVEEESNQQTISYRLMYNSETIDYPVLRTPVNEWNIVGGFISEMSVDLVIASYNAVEDPVNNLRVEIAKEEDGNMYALGNFAMKAIVDSSYQQRDNPSRQLPDTVLITDGEFKVRIED